MLANNAHTLTFGTEKLQASTIKSEELPYDKQGSDWPEIPRFIDCHTIINCQTLNCATTSK